MNILKELYYGNVNPLEKRIKTGSEYAKFIEVIADSEEELNSCLDDEKKYLLNRIMDAQGEILDIESCEHFIEGVRIGAQFMLDTFLVRDWGQFTNQ